MTDKKLYSLTAIFDKPDDIIHAAEKVSGSGYTKYDVNTPYPVHGLDGAMKLPPSKLGYAALALGLSGTLAGVLMIYFMSVLDYPIVIGGKPFFALPAFIPIMFEITVLAAAVGTVVTMLFFFFKFPNNNHPLHDTEYMKQVSLDKYGVSIQADDPKFNEEEIKTMFTGLGAASVSPVYWNLDEVNHENKILDPKFLGLLALTAIIVSGTVYVSLNKLMFMTPFNWMMEQERANPQETSTFFFDGFGMRPPVEGTIARGDLPYQFRDKPEMAAELLANPLIASTENFELGKTKYNIYCSPCHGYFGEGDSRMNGQFPNPPSLHSQKLRDWTDGRIYHVIQVGQNVMPSYSSQMSNNEKWATILYIRALQRSLNAKESDL
jgi:mono/diheme cytochrome c family protein